MILQEAWGEAARLLAQVVNEDTFRSLEGKSKHQLWLELCHIITRHPDDVIGINVDAVLRSGIRKFTDEVGCPLLLGAHLCDALQSGSVQGSCVSGVCQSAELEGLPLTLHGHSPRVPRPQEAKGVSNDAMLRSTPFIVV